MLKKNMIKFNTTITSFFRTILNDPFKVTNTNSYKCICYQMYTPNKTQQYIYANPYQVLYIGLLVYYTQHPN